MISKAACRYIRISPRKTRLVADMVRGKSIDEAQAILSNLEVRPRLYIQQVLKSAVANATGVNPDISAADLYISKIVIDCGPMFKRYRAGSMGRAMMIKHRTSHISIELDVKKSTENRVQSTEKRKKEKKQITKEKRSIVQGKTKKLVAAKRGK